MKPRGIASLELAFLYLGAVVAIVALQFYIRNAAASRTKQGIEALSPTLADPARIELSMVRCQQTTDTQQGQVPGRSESQFSETSRSITSSAAIQPLVNCL